MLPHQFRLGWAVACALACAPQAMAQAPVAPAPAVAADNKPPDPQNGVDRLTLVYGLLQRYRALHGGALPVPRQDKDGAPATDVVGDVLNHPKLYGFDTASAVADALQNPDDAKKDDFFARHGIRTMPGIIRSRPDGTPVGGPKRPSEVEVLAYTGTYFTEKAPGSTRPQIENPVGFFQLLGEDGQIWRVDYDEQLFIYDLAPDKPDSLRLRPAFPRQAGVPYNCLTYEEKWQALSDVMTSGPFFDEQRGKVFRIVPGPESTAQLRRPRLGARLTPQMRLPAPDNGAIESLVSLSRLRRASGSRPLDRPALWKLFGAARDVFSLQDTRRAALKVDVPLEQKPLALDDLARLNTPAILLTAGNRQVTLAQLDDMEAIVLDRGATKILPREQLAQMYQGQALFPVLDAQEKAPQVLVDDAVRVLPVKSLDEPIAVEVSIFNAGASPLTLQIERPIPGCENAELSSGTLAPGQSATLSLSLRWRSVLKSPTQNVLAFVATNDPRRPRLPLGFMLDNRRYALLEMPGARRGTHKYLPRPSSP